MKKIISLFVCMALMFCFPTSAFATPSVESQVNLDADWILENATYISSRMDTITSDRNEPLYVYVDNYVVARNENNEIISIAASNERPQSITSFDLVSFTNQTRGSFSDSESDSAYSVIFSMTINFTNLTSNGNTFRRMTSVSGSYSIIDSQVSLTQQYCVVGEMGNKYPGTGADSSSATYLLANTATSWSKSLSASTFPGVLIPSDLLSQTADYYYTIKRTKSGSSWSGCFNITMPLS